MAEVKTFEEAFDSVVAELKELMIKKHRDYGPKNITDFGEPGVLMRVNDKVNRLKNLSKIVPLATPQNESIEDSWKDLANYSIIALMLRRGIFELPLQEK